MTARFSAAIVAFAVATAFVAAGGALPEFFVQLRDPNLLGGTLWEWILRTFGFAFVIGLCAALTAAAVLLAAWRTRLRGASDWHCGLAAIFIALCLTGRLGVSLDPIGWVCAAAICLLLDRDDNWSVAAIVAIGALWSLLQGGATLGALLTILATCAALIESRRFDARVSRKLIAAAGCTIVALAQLHGNVWGGYGAHALYLDSLLSGAQRDRLWVGSISAQDVGFAAIVVVAGWYGIRRRGHLTDAFTFFALFALALVDARNLPYFGLLGAPIVADAVASYYVERRTVPAGKLPGYAIAFAAAACAFVAALTAFEPKTVQWPRPDSAPLLAMLWHDGARHRVLCIQPRSCDAASYERATQVAVVLDDRGGIATMRARRIERDVANALGSWRSELRAAGVDAIVAKEDDPIVSLLDAAHWQRARTCADGVLLQRIALR